MKKIQSLLLSTAITILPFSFTCRHVQAADVRLAWTSPGDDCSTGTATLYELVAFQASVTLTQLLATDTSDAACGTGSSHGIPRAQVDAKVSGLRWWSTQSGTMPSPLVAGTSQSLTVTGIGGGHWYFAIRAIDDAGNISGWAYTEKDVDLTQPQKVAGFNAQ